MLMSEIFDRLTFGELGSLFMSGLDANKKIQPDFYPQMISHLNTGLDAIYTKFPIKMDQVFVQQYEQIERYILDYRFAVTNTASQEPIKYIVDSVEEPFNDKVFVIEKVVDEGGKELFLNDESYYWTIWTPAPNIIQIPYAQNENSVSITYRSGLAKIHPEDFIGASPTFTPEDYYIDLPAAFLNLLLLYIAARQFGVLNGDQNQEGNTYMQKYEIAAADIHKQGLYNKSTMTNQKLEIAGWV